MENDSLRKLQEWVDIHLGTPALAGTPGFLPAELRLVKDLLIQVHSVRLDPLAEPMLALDLSQE